jgi:hypothetical protein|tara:strand:+ start:596 stop:796 length:201 start_codon:yes stop_codon:yes gene_type:complete
MQVPWLLHTTAADSLLLLGLPNGQTTSQMFPVYVASHVQIGLPFNSEHTPWLLQMAPDNDVTGHCN